jgi:MFS family permease
MAGRLSDSMGRKVVLVAGWIMALPVPFLLMWAPTWNWILFANALLGISQGLTWSTTVIMKIDLVGPHRRGLAMGLNEFAGYGAVALTALLTGYIAAAYVFDPNLSIPALASPFSASFSPSFWSVRLMDTFALKSRARDG